MNKRLLKAVLSAIIIPFLFSGCAVLFRDRVPVKFIKPSEKVQYKMVQPDENEKNGVDLRFWMKRKPLFYKDSSQIFTQVKDGSALPLRLETRRKVSFEKGKAPGTFYMITKTSGQRIEDLGYEQILINKRGAILKFIEGRFQADNGSVKFLSHTRTPIFPANSVRIGDTWSYNETMETVLDSSYLKKKSNGPDKIKVNCELKGFAVFNGRRCAVIHSRAVTSRNERYETWFKELKIHVNVFADEILFFDYKQGIILGTITKTESYSVSEKKDFSDESRSQQISYLEKKAK